MKASTNIRYEQQFTAELKDPLCQHSTCPSCSLSWVRGSSSHWWHSFMITTLSSRLLNGAVFQLCEDMCVWFMEVWLGVIPQPGEPANTSTSSSPKLWIITLSICQHQHLSGPQEEPVAHSSFIPVALSRCAHTSRGLWCPWGPQLYLLFHLGPWY